MLYYVVTDPHGFCTQLKKSLAEQGFFEQTQPCRVIVCGDVLDRGPEAVETVNFLLELARQDKLIYIMGNHEELLVECLAEIAGACHGGYARVSLHHMRNGTWDTLLQLSGMEHGYAGTHPRELVTAVRATPFYRELLPLAINYYETGKYVFCHGWLPTQRVQGGPAYRPDWRDADEYEWSLARWANGMQYACRYGITEPDKTVVCGHFHTSWGHSVIDGKCAEWGENADFSAFYAPGIIALDGCCAYSGRINCVVLEDDPLSDEI